MGHLSHVVNYATETQAAQVAYQGNGLIVAVDAVIVNDVTDSDVPNCSIII